MNEWYMVENQIAQSGTSRAPHFAWGLLKKSLDQSNRQERHAAISCHVFCSTAWLYPLFCTYSCQQYQLNTTQCSTSCGKCAQLNCPHTHTRRHSRVHTCIQIHTYTHNYCDHFLAHPAIMTWLPMSHKTHPPFLDPIAGSHCHILTFSPIQLIKHSLSFIGKAIPVNGLITDSKLRVFSPAIRQLRLKESLLFETAPHSY